MKRINVYDYDAERIEKICEKYDLYEPQVIELLLDNIVEAEEDIIFR